jgi:hypothetical protein
MHSGKRSSKAWVAHTSRVLATAFHRRELCWTLALSENHGGKESSSRWNSATSTQTCALPSLACSSSQGP